MAQWTDADVAASLEAIRDRGNTPEPAPVRPVRPGDLAALRHSVTTFWDTRGDQFSAWWRALPPPDRRRLLRVVAPHMPAGGDAAPRAETGEDMSGTAALCPEMNLDALSGDPSALPRLYAARRCPLDDYDAAWEAEVADLDAVRAACRRGYRLGRPPGRGGAAP